MRRDYGSAGGGGGGGGFFVRRTNERTFYEQRSDTFASGDETVAPRSSMVNNFDDRMGHRRARASDFNAVEKRICAG